jgi:hypothetical protein
MRTPSTTFAHDVHAPSTVRHPRPLLRVGEPTRRRYARGKENADWADTVTINVAAAPMPCSVPEQNSELSVPSKVRERSARAHRIHLSSPWRPPFPPTFIVRSRRLEKLSDDILCSLSLRERWPSLHRSPRQRSARSRRTFGDMSIDWIMPEG